jgi:hypothetical protein
MDTNGKHLQIKEVKIEVAQNVPNKNAKRKILDKKISVIVCTASAFVSKL